ncbi:unnamed protein product [Scytosiphon promiscuus]
MSTRDQTLSFPSAKRRCWDLIIVRDRDCKSEQDNGVAVEETEVLEAFRKKYTSAKKVVFKPSTAGLNGGDVLDADGSCGVKGEEPTVKASEAASHTDGRICVQVEFAGPQPIKGPAEVLCGLLGGVSVAATPVFLARGRRKKRPKTCYDPTDEIAYSGVLDMENAGNGSSNQDCGGEGELEGATSAAAVDSEAPTAPMLSETSWESMSLWHPPAAPAEAVPVEDFLLEWGDIPHHADEKDGDEDGDFLCPSSTAELSTSPSSMSLLSGFRSTSSGLSTWEDYDCDAGMPPHQEAPAGLFESAFRASDKSAPPLFSPPSKLATGGVNAIGRADSPDVNLTPETRDHRANTASSSSSTASIGGDSSTTSSPEQQRHPCSDASVTPAVTDGSINCAGEDGDLPDSKARIARGSRARESASSVARATTAAPPAAPKDGEESEDKSWEWWSVKGEPRGWRRSSAGETIGFGWLRRECDFDGHPGTPSEPPKEANLSTDSGSSSDKSISTVEKPCRLAFKGMDSTSLKVRDLSVHVRFSSSPTGNAVHNVATPLEADDGGHAGVKRCTVQYPSLEEMWPEMYRVRQILVIEVDMVVEIRSSDGKCLYTGPSLKVTYRRPKTSSGVPQSQQCTRVSSRGVLSNFFGQMRPGVYPAASSCVGACHSPKKEGECSCCTGRVVLGSPSSSSMGPMITPPEDSFAALLI